jgi:glycosyltransferase involved in cell wall biosynthesis
LRILLVTRWFPSSDAPHRGTFIEDWARLSARHAEVSVLHLDRGPRRGPLERVRCNTHPQLRVYRFPIAWKGARAPAKHIEDAWRAGSVIAELHRAQPFDLLHAHSYMAATAARLGARRCDLPYVVTEHFTRLIRGDARWYHRLEARYALRAAASVTAVGPALARATEQLAGQPVTIIPNSVPDSFAEASVADAGPPYRLLSVGRLERIKGFDVGLEALASLLKRVDVSWTIVGDGPEKEALQAEAHRLGVDDHVDLRGALSRSDVHRLMAVSHLTLVPSHSETFSVVAAESLMTGRPVVTTRCGGPEWFVGADQGRVVEVGDAAGLADAIEDVLRRLDQFPPRLLAGRARQSFSEDAVAARLGEVYAQALR